MEKSLLIVLFVGLAVMLVAGFLVYENLSFDPSFTSQHSAPEPVETPEQIAKNNTEKKLWGVYAGDTASSLGYFENLVGDKADMQAVFINWNEAFPADIAVALKKNNQTLVIFWEQYDVELDRIISGAEDEYIVQFADDAKAYGAPVILAPLHEMNGDWSPWSGVVGGNSPQKVIWAFRHIEDVFSTVNANDVKWAWVVNHESVPDTSENQIENYYPGSDYVDYTGIDGFNFGDPWMSYSEIFSDALAKLKAYQKPVIIFSMASAEGPEKADWIQDALLKIKNNPDIKGFIWFNENKEKNWLINSDPESLQAFKEGIK